MRKQKQILSLFFALLLSLSLITPSFALTAENTKIQNSIQKTVKFMQNQTPKPNIGTVSGDWTVMTLARSNQNIAQEYYDNYYKNVVDFVKTKKGKLHDKKYTEYSRLILTLTAIGKNPSDVGGYDLLSYLGDFEKVVYQGINGPIFALLALDSKNYPMPISKDAKIKASRQMYIKYILDRQIPSDGGFSLDGKKGDVDITSMAIQALSKYKNQRDVKIAIDKAIVFLQNSQGENGGYSSWNTENAESIAQVILALTEMKINPSDERFVKNGNTLISNLLTFYDESGGFLHVKSDSSSSGKQSQSDVIATDQGMQALIAYDRYQKGQNSYYDMTDVEIKYPDTKNKSVLRKTLEKSVFKDISDSKNKEAIEFLAEKNIIKGITQDEFKPDETMSRAQFSTIIVKALKLEVIHSDQIFNDVTTDKWYYNYVNSAYKNGIINGVSKYIFNPQGKITKQEASVIIYNAAKLSKKNTNINQVEINTYLPQFTDYEQSAKWSRQAITYMIKNGIISPQDIQLQPEKQLSRAEIAQMIYQMFNID